jgi:hypothetical protein
MHLDLKIRVLTIALPVVGEDVAGCREDVVAASWNALSTAGQWSRITTHLQAFHGGLEKEA